MEKQSNANIHESEKKFHIDNLRDKLGALEIAYSKLSPKQLQLARTQAEQDGRIADMEKFQPSAIIERLENCLRNFDPATQPEMLPQIYQTASRLTEKLFSPAITNGINEALEDLVYEKNDQLKQETLGKIIEIFEHLKQVAKLVEDIKIEDKDIKTIE